MQVTVDGFLGGRLRLAQPKTGYRAGIDPVLLAAACPAQSGQEVLELGCGVGVASLCLGRRVPGLGLNGVEILGEYAQIARENSVRNSIQFDVRQGDVSARPTPFFDRSFHHVIMNPPYFSADASSISPEAGRASGRSEQVALSHWVDMAAKRLLNFRSRWAVRANDKSTLSPIDLCGTNLDFSRQGRCRLRRTDWSGQNLF